MIRFESLYVISVSTDVSWDNVPIAYWTAIESNVGIVCACLPSLKQLLLRFIPILMHSSPSTLLADAEGPWEQQHRFIKSAGHNHDISTAARGPGFRGDRVGLTVSRLGNDPGIPVLIQDQYRDRFVLIGSILD
jgi:hypothetical protein